MIFVGRGYGLVAADVETWLGPFMADYYRRIQGNPSAYAAATQAFQRYANSRGLYTFGPRDPDGDWGNRTEAAWNALLPGASGVTTARALERLRDLAPDLFLTQIQLGIAVARDQYLRGRGVIQTAPDPGTQARTGVPGGMGDPAAQADTAARYLADQGEALVATLTSSVDAEPPNDEATQIQGGRGTIQGEPPAAPAPAPMSTAKKAGLGILIVILVLGAGVGIVLAARRSPPSRALAARKRRGGGQWS